jgi:IS30 family transposase
MLYPADDFRERSQMDMSRIARLLNERSRKTLDYKTSSRDILLIALGITESLIIN